MRQFAETLKTGVYRALGQADLSENHCDPLNTRERARRAARQDVYCNAKFATLPHLFHAFVRMPLPVFQTGCSMTRIQDARTGVRA